MCSFVNHLKSFTKTNRVNLWQVLEACSSCESQSKAFCKSFFPPSKIKTIQRKACRNFSKQSQNSKVFVYSFCLCCLFFADVIVQDPNTLLAGVCFQFQEGKLFNLLCLKAKTKITEQLIQELLFAEAASLVVCFKQELRNWYCNPFKITMNFGFLVRRKKKKKKKARWAFFVNLLESLPLPKTFICDQRQKLCYILTFKAKFVC